MWWTQQDLDIWDKSGLPVAADLDKFTDLDNEDLIHCASLYHSGNIKGLAAAAKARAAQQQQGWFSLWRRGHGQWVDLLTGLTVSAPGQDADQVALARVLPQGEGWELHFPGRERLTPGAAETLLRRLRYTYAGPQWLLGRGPWNCCAHGFNVEDCIWGHGRNMRCNCGHADGARPPRSPLRNSC